MIKIEMNRQDNVLDGTVRIEGEPKAIALEMVYAIACASESIAAKRFSNGKN